MVLNKKRKKKIATILMQRMTMVKINASNNPKLNVKLWSKKRKGSFVKHFKEPFSKEKQTQSTSKGRITWPLPLRTSINQMELDLQI